MNKSVITKANKKFFTNLKQNFVKTNTLTAAVLLLFTTGSIAQTQEVSKPKFDKNQNHIDIEVGTGIGKLEDKQLSDSEIEYNSLSLRLGYEHHFFFLQQDLLHRPQKLANRNSTRNKTT